MTFEQFNVYQKQLIDQVVAMKDTKGKEYANSGSRFANFDRLAARLKISNLQVALVYMTKHIDAIESYIANGKTYSTESIEGRIVDAITYLTLIAGMIAERDKPLETVSSTITVTPGSPGQFITFEDHDKLIKEIDRRHTGTGNDISITCGDDLKAQLSDHNTGKHQPMEYDARPPMGNYEGLI